jgi:hypothetical protein
MFLSEVNIMKRVAFVVSVLLIAGVAYSQEMLTNAGFETGDYTGWTTCGGQTLLGDQYTPIPHSGSYATQACGCCGQHDAGGGYQQVSTNSGIAYFVGGWARTCSYGGSSVTDIGYGGTTCGTPTTVIGSTPEPPDCVWYQIQDVVEGETSIPVHYAWPATGWGATCSIVDDMTLVADAVHDWMFY